MMVAPITLTIPDDLIFEQILPRLSVKSLIRFRSVCKNWYNLISTSKFAKSHLEFSISTSRFLITDGELGFRLNFYSLAYDEPNKLKELAHLDTQVTYGMLDIVLIVGCCNGLVCLHCQNNCDYFFALWNPATHQYRKIYPPFKDFLIIGGFGFASAIDDYKIVAFIPTFTELSTDIHLWVFSLKAGEWEHSVLSSYYKFLLFEGLITDGVLVNDTLYWTVRKQVYAGQTKGIFIFNLVDEQITEITISGSADLYILRSVINGCLALYRNNIYHPREVWIMKLKSDGNSFEKLFSIPRSNALYHMRLYWLPNGKCLIKHVRKLKLIDPAEEDIEPSHGIDFDGSSFFSLHPHTESLISPFGTAHTALNDEDNDVNNGT